MKGLASKRRHQQIWASLMTHACGYVYGGGSVLALQDKTNNRVLWTHQDPYAKSQRITDANGEIVAGVELEPFGLETNRSFDYSAVSQKRQFTTYERDGNNSDEAMLRRYNRWGDRFDQPDPYDGSMSLGDPQSLNRYAYVQNDPVNFVDPTGALAIGGGCGFYDYESGVWVPRICDGDLWLRFVLNSRFAGLPQDPTSKGNTLLHEGGHANKVCTFNFNITDNTGQSPETIAALQKEITRIYQAAGLRAVFNNAAAANGGTFNITIQESPGSNPIAPGWTPPDSNGGVSQSGFVSTKVLQTSIQSDPDAAQRQLGIYSTNFGTALGRIIAHESGHYFLQVSNRGHVNGSLMQASFHGRQWFAQSENNTFKFTQPQSATLSKKC